MALEDLIQPYIDAAQVTVNKFRETREGKTFTDEEIDGILPFTEAFALIQYADVHDGDFKPILGYPAMFDKEQELQNKHQLPPKRVKELVHTGKLLVRQVRKQYCARLSQNQYKIRS